MAKIIGHDEYLSKKIYSNKAHGLSLLAILFIALGIFWIYFLSFQYTVLGLYIRIGIVLIVYFLLKRPIEKILHVLRQYRKGLNGELYIRSLLERLPDTYVVFHGITLSKDSGNIDFVVVGPNCTFAIEVKSHKGNITFNGKELLRNGQLLEKNFLYQARGEAIGLGNYLRSQLPFPIYVQSVIVFSNAHTTMRFGETPIYDVIIIGYRWLVGLIESHKTKYYYSSEQLDQIVNLLIESHKVSDTIVNRA